MEDNSLTKVPIVSGRSPTLTDGSILNTLLMKAVELNEEQLTNAIEILEKSRNFIMNSKKGMKICSFLMTKYNVNLNISIQKSRLTKGNLEWSEEVMLKFRIEGYEPQEVHIRISSIGEQRSLWLYCGFYLEEYGINVDFKYSELKYHLEETTTSFLPNFPREWNTETRCAFIADLVSKSLSGFAVGFDR